MFGITERRDFSYKIQRKTNAESYKIQFSSSHLSLSRTVYTYICIYATISIYLYIPFYIYHYRQSRGTFAGPGWVFTEDSFLHEHKYI